MIKEEAKELFSDLKDGSTCVGYVVMRSGKGYEGQEVGMVHETLKEAKEAQKEIGKIKTVIVKYTGKIVA